MRSVTFIASWLLILSAAVAIPPESPIADSTPVKQTTPTDISSRLDEIITKHDLPAMAAVVIRGDTIVAEGVAGVRFQGSDEKATLRDLWHLGSCTKSMTATMCAILVEQGTLRWDSTLAEVFPDLAERMHDDYKKVTLSQLLTNRGGVPHELNFDDLWGRVWRFNGSPKDARRLLLEGIITRAPDYPPGTKDVYSNAGFSIAGHMAEIAAKKPYESLMSELLFAPLGMTSVGWGPPGTWGDNPNAAQPWGHRKNGKPVDPSKGNADNPAAISPAGRAHCTIGDWAKYVAVHLRADPLNEHRNCRLLKPETFDRLHAPPDALSTYAYGWGRPERGWAGPEGSRFVLTHAGSNTMWFCVTWIAPKRDFAVLVCCNSGEEAAPKACDEACWSLIREQTKE